MSRRRAGNNSIGSSQPLYRASVHLHCGLLRIASSLPPTPRVEPKRERIPGVPRKAHVPPACDPVTDELLAQMRGDHELRGMKPAEVARKYGAEHGLPEHRVQNLLRYTTRAHIDPR